MTTLASDSPIEIRRHQWKNVFWGIFSVVLVAFVCTTISPGDLPGLRLVVHLTSIVFLTTMAGFWLGLGIGLLRFPGSILGALSIGVVFGLVVDSAGSMLHPLFCLIITLVTGFSAYLIRHFSGELLRTGPDQQIDESLQFGICHILIWTTIVAVVIAIFQILSFESMSSQSLQMVCVLASAYSITAAVMIWSMLGATMSWARIGICLAFVTAAGGVAHLYFDGRNFWVFVTFFSQLLIACSLLCVRMQDYRFIPRAAK